MKNIAIVGAGLVGSLQAMFLAKRGYNVEVYERRSDQRKIDFIGGKSINLALSNRGWKALEHVGVADEIRKIAIPMKGRIMHSITGDLTFQPYGKEGEAIYSVSRGRLNQILMNLAEPYPNVDYFFDMKCQNVNLKEGSITFKNLQNNSSEIKKFDHIFGTDGAFSKVRLGLQKTDRFDYSQSYLKHGYKELSILPNADGTHKLDKNALHIWPRGEFMLIALANLDGSFTCTLFIPFEGENSFHSLNSNDKVISFFKKYFPDALAIMPNLIDDYNENPSSSLVIIKANPWHYENKAVLMGDASHAIVPFYGQGMNAGFEDCTVFDNILNECNDDFSLAFNRFSDERKADADAISDLALYNFIEMRDLTGNKEFLLQKKIEKKLLEKHPDKWVPLYSLVTFSHIPYSEAMKKGMKQNQIMEEVMKTPNIESLWDSDEIEKTCLRLLEK